mmetsp:Transcript_28083/g.41778  ORF Transcript_28083/g.41778 Transcript_28083/m.41778 type:complete len:217 (-) Transcript_28083:259-909(-)
MPRGYMKNCKSVNNKVRRGGSSKHGKHNMLNQCPKPEQNYNRESKNMITKTTEQQRQTIWHCKGWKERKGRCKRGCLRDLHAQDDSFALSSRQGEKSNNKMTPQRCCLSGKTPNQCQICFERNGTVVDLAGCGHYACRACLKQQYIIQPQMDASKYKPSKRGASLVCFGHRCKEAISGHQLKHIGLLERREDQQFFYRFRTIMSARGRGREVIDCC